MTQTLFVDKSSSTFADALAAYGLALVVHEVLDKTAHRQKPTVRLSDQGGYYRIDCKPAWDDDLLSRLSIPYAPGAPIIRTAKNAKKLPQNLPPAAFVEYEAERDRRASYFEARKALSKEALRALNQGQDHPELNTLQGLSPHPNWDVFRAINPSALIGYNKLLVFWWQIEEAQHEALMLLRDCFAQMPNDVDGAIAAWKALDKAYGWGISPTITALQLYNPAQGKGQNRAKASKLTMGNVKAFWLLEWLKVVGFYESALTKQLRGVKDRKSYVLAPSEIDWKANAEIMKTFQGSMNRSETAVRSDVLVALRYTQALLEYSQEGQNAVFQARMVRRGGPSRVISGFYSAFYKNLGNSAATMNLSFIGLPTWIHIHDAQDVRDALAVLVEHEAIVRQFDESHSDDFDLLLNYRDFIAASDLWPFFRFTTAYSSYIISQRERSNGRARQLNVENLRRLIVSAEPKLSKILEIPGFQNIAYAIRQSTVIAQYKRKKLNDRRYDVRYGLNQELARKANYPGDFIAALSDFLHRYNAENAQVMESRKGPYRRSIQTSDVEDIVALVDEYGPQLICNLLIAYGYAREPRTDNGQAEETEGDEG